MASIDQKDSCGCDQVYTREENENPQSDQSNVMEQSTTESTSMEQSTTESFIVQNTTASTTSQDGVETFGQSTAMQGESAVMEHLPQRSSLVQDEGLQNEDPMQQDSDIIAPTSMEQSKTESISIVPSTTESVVSQDGAETFEQSTTIQGESAVKENLPQGSSLVLDEREQNADLMQGDNGSFAARSKLTQGDGAPNEQNVDTCHNDTGNIKESVDKNPALQNDNSANLEKNNVEDAIDISGIKPELVDDEAARVQVNNEHPKLKAVYSDSDDSLKHPKSQVKRVMMSYRVPGSSSDISMGTDESGTDSSDIEASLSSDDSENDWAPGKKKEAQKSTTQKKKREGEDLRTKGELLPKDLPPIEELKITIDDNVTMQEVGHISGIVGVLAIVQAQRDLPALDIDTILFNSEKKPFGQVFETFGPVTSPLYSVRFNDAEHIERQGITLGMMVYYAPQMEQYTKYVFIEQLKRMRGSDASWEHNNEPPDRMLDYSDDDEERKVKRGDVVEEEQADGTQGKKRRKRKTKKKNMNGYTADISESDGFPEGDGASGGMFRPRLPGPSESVNQWPPPGPPRWRQPGPPQHQKPWRGPPPPRGFGPGPSGIGPRGPRFGDNMGGPGRGGYRPGPPPHFMGPPRPRIGGPPHMQQRILRPAMDMRYVQNQDNMQPPHRALPPHQFGASPHFPPGPQHNYGDPRYQHLSSPDSWS